MLQFHRRRVLVAVHLAALGINARHHMLDRAVFSGRIHRLEDQQDRMLVRRKQDLLPCAEAGNVPVEDVPVVLLRTVHRADLGRQVVQADPAFSADAKTLCVDLHRHLPHSRRRASRHRRPSSCLME